MRTWARELQQNAKTGRRPGYRVVLREVRHRIIGANSVPEEVWIDTLDDAFGMINKRREAEIAAVAVGAETDDAPSWGTMNRLNEVEEERNCIVGAQRSWPTN